MFWSLVTRRDVAARALKTSVLVGFILIIINHGDELIRGEVDFIRLLKMLLTFAVPYCVSTYASVSTLRNLENVEGPPAATKATEK
jgi:hypothetical protein